MRLGLFGLIAKVLIATLCLLALTGSIRPSQLDTIQARGELVVVTRNSPTTYYQDRSGDVGYEYELAKSFADHLGVRLRVVVADNLQQVFTTLETGQAAIATAGLTITAERQRWVRFAEPYMYVTEQVIYRRGRGKPTSLEQLADGKLVVSADSSHAQRLRQLQREQTPSLSWHETDELGVTDLLHLVESGQVDYTVVDSNEFDLLQAYFPNLAVGFELISPQPIAWAFPHSRDDSLHKAANRFFTQHSTQIRLARLAERYYGHLESLDYVGAIHFLNQADKKLAKFKPHFQQAAEKHEFDWRLLAAVGYQESHWRANARSYTGVRGLMMLTRPTAKELGVKNRLDPVQSIDGGSRYLAQLRKRLKGVNEPDRTWMALAAYNVGYGHLNDARKIAREMGGNPNSWMDVKDALPLLTQKRYYRHTRHGYARGHEPVEYVQNIRRYYDVLVWNEQQPQTATTDEQMLTSLITEVPPLL
ncbi:lytic transglycosylase F [Bacterioplanes sanyensis]|uniref:Membrane-bound lytic murein transglycosylase F n=2 Tax=Bacterioplanes sanyensis TaxID=1249553 RepID=A0A222FQA9_9GAMM|nr:lytic transglycosylase F [Bacterioplanes sanyensis]